MALAIAECPKQADESFPTGVFGASEYGRYEMMRLALFGPGPQPAPPPPTKFSAWVSCIARVRWLFMLQTDCVVCFQESGGSNTNNWLRERTGVNTFGKSANQRNGRVNASGTRAPPSASVPASVPASVSAAPSCSSEPPAASLDAALTSGVVWDHLGPLKAQARQQSWNKSKWNRHIRDNTA